MVKHRGRTRWVKHKTFKRMLSRWRRGRGVPRMLKRLRSYNIK